MYSVDALHQVNSPSIMSKEIIVAESWPHLMEVLFRQSWAEHLNRYRSAFVYRGLADFDYPLTTTLNRLGESHLEKHLLRNFIKYSKVTTHGRNIWNWLALAQHHGLPTRLLDWTYSPLVALHFAVAEFNSFHKDGVIWAVNYVDSKRLLPDQLKIAIEEEGSHIFTAEMLDRVVATLPDLQKLKKGDYGLFFEPPSMDERIVNQYALFSMMSDPKTVISDWIESAGVEYFQVKIPASLKWEIRDKLDQSNINERVLFPGLDGLAIWLKRHYLDIRDMG